MFATLWPGALLVVTASSAHAQELLVTHRQLSVSVGASQFDLSGTGTAPMAAVRLALPTTRVLLFEAGFAVARPEQQFGTTTTLFLPEVGVQLQMPRRVAPYAGVGVGGAFDFRPDDAGGTQSGITASGAVGIRAEFSQRAGGIAELRIRGIGSSFNSSAAEWTVGGIWRI